MVRIARVRRFWLIGALVALSLACGPLLSSPSTTSEPEVSVAPALDTDEIVATVVAQVEARLEDQGVTPAGNETILAAEPGLEAALTTVYRVANPSVVYIIVSSAQTSQSASFSSGSGFVYDDQGRIVTNNHVVAAGGTYEIVFASGERRYATLIGSDVDSDLAVLQVDSLPSGVQPLALGEPDALDVGQLVVAIGNPFGEQGSMSFGIVSGLGRDLRSQRVSSSGSSYSLPSVIQVDAPINPGNSGGPLLDLSGRVVGVNAAIATDTGTGTGVGFSIPVIAVYKIVPGLIENGEHTYSYMGVTFDGEITLADVELFGLSQTQGAYVIELAPGSPAARAGLIAADPSTGRGGDLVVAIDGRSVSNFNDLNAYLVFETSPDQEIELTVLRDGDRVDVPLTLGARP